MLHIRVTASIVRTARRWVMGWGRVFGHDRWPRATPKDTRAATRRHGASSRPTRPARRGRSVVPAAAGAARRKVVELRQRLVEEQLHHAGRPVALLADDDLGHARLLARVLVVVVVAVDEHDHIGILLDGA